MCRHVRRMRIVPNSLVYSNTDWGLYWVFDVAGALTSACQRGAIPSARWLPAVRFILAPGIPPRWQALPMLQGHGGELTCSDGGLAALQ
jgi:hypothetical protein